MNRQESDILKSFFTEPYVNQRMLAEESGYSLGVVNRCVRSLTEAGYLDENMRPTRLAAMEYNRHTPRNAVILAAGLGMRMIPINTMMPKGLLEVRGEPLIERLIRQLKEAGVSEIIIVAGFMKEKFEYLIDEYGVELVVNPDYAIRNNLYSLRLVADRLSDTYIVPCDIWCKENVFHRHELYSWYMVSDSMDAESEVKVNRKMELVSIPKSLAGNKMIGISYLTAADSAVVRERIKTAVSMSGHEDDFWESVLYTGDRMMISARIVPAAAVSEINTYEQLRELDAGSNQLKADALDVISSVFQVSLDKIHDIRVLKKGMTNRSFIFSVNGKKYIMRIPGEGTSRLINRKEEADVYRTISGLGFCDDPVYISSESGYKITAFLDNVRVADSENLSDVRHCMEKLHEFHALNLQVAHSFDLFEQIEFYERLWGGQPSIYRDYFITKRNVLSLKQYIDCQDKQWALTHIDAVPDNFLFYVENGEEKLQLSDWEYAGMQDPHVDIAMFCIYSFYDKDQVDWMIDLYFEGRCDKKIRIKIYCYIAVCGLLWSNWCEYKRGFGVEFGEYSLKQYRYAKDYYRYAKNEMDKSECQ